MGTPSLSNSLTHALITSSGAGFLGWRTISAVHPKTLRTQRYAQKLWIEDFVRHAVYLPQKVIERADVAAAAGRNTDVEHTPRWPSPRRTQPRPRRDRPCRSKEDAGPRAGGRGRCLHRSG